MSSVSGESGGSRNHDNDREDLVTGEDGSDDAAALHDREESGFLTKDILAEEQERVREELSSGANGTSFVKRTVAPVQDVEDDSASELSIKQLEQNPESPLSSSIPDDTPSVQGSVFSSLASSRPASHRSLSRLHRPASLQPFERRFSSRLSPSPLGSPRTVSSPAFLSIRSRQSSISSNFPQAQDDSDTPQAPWEVVRWTKLRSITKQLFSEAGRRNFGRPTCLSVAASLVVGTSKGLILVFDYQQVLKSIIGSGTKAVECGPVTALAISADHTTIAGGHATGYIFTWELARPARPFLSIQPLERSQLDDRRADGHVSGASILHIGFLGTRHTALVSADDGGMAFAHLATRGLGAVGRTVKTTRILGRYPLGARSTEKPRKPSSVLAFAPLPLGNVEQPTDEMGLTALITPYTLVIVSTTPVAQTQHKALRPKEIAQHSTWSGCLAWFPAVKLKNPTGDPNHAVSRTKLVYCWLNILTILDVEYEDQVEKGKPAELNFRPRSRWRSEEAIVAVQWLSRSVLGVLTISQRLVILEDDSRNALRMTDSFDLLHKHIYHADLFSKQLQPVVENLDETDTSMHGVVADGFYMSFRAYKGRLFLLGFDDISIGTLLNWADRLLALMEDGDFIGAIELATSYYRGDAERLTVGLPEDDTARHVLVQEKLLEMISASLRYAFSRNDEDGNDKRKLLADLATVCFKGCMSMEEMDFLFENVYDAYEEKSLESIFFETLEPYILDEAITAVPPNVLKDMISFYASSGRAIRLEDMLCRLKTDTMDLNQVTALCQEYNLYDALIYVWTRAIGDFITPLIKILTLIKTIDFDEDDEAQNPYLTSALKVFPFLAYSLTGRVYPNGTFLDESEAIGAKKVLYGFLFSGKTMEWPPGSGSVFSTLADNSPEASFPYLRLILEFDAASFMSMLNEVFEDSFLNGEHDVAVNGSQINGSQSASGLTPTRQYIINVLLGIMTTDNFDPEDIIYFYMFIARNLPKYPQHIMLPGSSLHQILGRLCNFPTGAMKDDCQLSVEYLLSVYHPPDLHNLVHHFEKAGFHRVLKNVYRGSQQYAKLLGAYLDDVESKEAVFDCIRDCLGQDRGLTKKQINDVKAVIMDRAPEIVAVDPSKAAQILRQYAPDLLASVLDSLEPESKMQYQFLQTLVERVNQQTSGVQFAGEDLPSGFSERYVQLLCKFNSAHVAEFVSLLKSGDLRLQPVLPALEKSGVIDAAVVLMARDGLVTNAMERLVKHLGTLESALTSLIKAASESPDTANTEEAIRDLLGDILKYCKVGIWLCQGQTRAKAHSQPSHANGRFGYGDVSEQGLELDELLWLDLVDSTVGLTKHVSSATVELSGSTHSSSKPTSQLIDTSKISTTLRSAVQQTFSALLASTTAAPRPQSSSTAENSNRSTQPPQLRRHHSQFHTNPSFLCILRAFLARASKSSPSLSDLRSVLAEIFSAYTFEETILALANRFLDKDAFTHVQEVHVLRQRGWRPRGQVCEGCKKRAWGPGAGGDIWDAWERAGEREIERRIRTRGSEEQVRKLERGKGKRTNEEHEGEDENGNSNGSGGLVVFACRHMWHQKCLEKAVQSESAPDERPEGARRFKCPICV